MSSFSRQQHCLHTAKAMALVGAVFLAFNAHAQSSYQFIELKKTALDRSGAINGISQLGNKPASVLQVNNAGQVIGATVSYTHTVFAGSIFGAVYDKFASVWSATGTPTQLPINIYLRNNATRYQGVYGFNNAGVIVGFSAPGGTAGDKVVRPSKWVNNKITRIDSRPGYATAINESGVIVGVITDKNIDIEPQLGYGGDGTQERATVWRDGQAFDLQGSLSSLPADISTRPTAINSAGQIALVHTQRLNSSRRGVACFVVTGSTVQNLELPAQTNCYLKGLSDSGMPVGNISPINWSADYSGTDDVGVKPAMWLDGQLHVLPTNNPPVGTTSFLNTYKDKSIVYGVSKGGVIFGTDQGTPVFWINGVQKVFNTPITRLPTDARVTKILGMSDNGKLLVEIFSNSKGVSAAVLAPKP